MLSEIYQTLPKCTHWLCCDPRNQARRDIVPQQVERSQSKIRLVGNAKNTWEAQRIASLGTDVYVYSHMYVHVYVHMYVHVNVCKDAWKLVRIRSTAAG